MYEYDNSYVYIALDKAQEFAALGEGVTGIEVKTTDRWQAIECRRATHRRAWLAVPNRGLAGAEPLALPGAQAREAGHGRDPAADRAWSRRSTSSAR